MDWIAVRFLLAEPFSIFSYGFIETLLICISSIKKSQEMLLNIAIQHMHLHLNTHFSVWTWKWSVQHTPFIVKDSLRLIKAAGGWWGGGRGGVIIHKRFRAM